MGRLFDTSDSREQAVRQAQAIRQQTEHVLNELVQLYASLREVVWHIPDLDSREFNNILTALGSDGPKVKAVMTGLASMINTAAPATLGEEEVSDPVTLTLTNGTLRADVRGTYPGRR